MLHPGISGTGWDSGLGTRVVLFRDWTFQTTETPSSQGEYVPGVRFAGVVKAKGVSYEGVGKVVALRIEKVRIHDHITTVGLRNLGRSSRNQNGPSQDQIELFGPLATHVNKAQAGRDR